MSQDNIPQRTCCRRTRFRRLAASRTWLRSPNTVHPSFTRVFRPERFVSDERAHPAVKESGRESVVGQVCKISMGCSPARSGSPEGRTRFATRNSGVLRLGKAYRSTRSRAYQLHCLEGADASAHSGSDGAQTREKYSASSNAGCLARLGAGALASSTGIPNVALPAHAQNRPLLHYRSAFSAILFTCKKKKKKKKKK